MRQRHCPLCQKIQATPNVNHFYAYLINSALYTKYSSKKSKNFQDFFVNKPIKWIIDFKDHLHLQDDDEYLKRFYPTNQQTQKFLSLLDYYKFHQNLPRIFFGVLAEIVISYFEKKKKYHYRKIKKMLGISYDQSSLSIQQERLNQEIQVLNSLTKITEKSTKSILNEFFKIQPNDEQKINIDETWLTMQQQELIIPQLKNKQGLQNLKILKKLVQNHSKEKIKLNLPFHLLKGKTLTNIRNSQNQSRERIHPTQQSSSQQHINKSQEENEFKSFINQKVLAQSKQNKIKVQEIFQNKNHIELNYNIITQGKRSSTHLITSTRSISSEYIKNEKIHLKQLNFNGQDSEVQQKLTNNAIHIPMQSMKQFTIHNDTSPTKKSQQLIQIYSNNFGLKLKTQPKKSPEKQIIFHPSNSYSSTLNNQKSLLQNFEKISPFQKVKMKLENSQQKSKKKKLCNHQNKLQIEDKQYFKVQSNTTAKNKVLAKSIIKNK